jgi:hypothetical protein
VAITSIPTNLFYRAKQATDYASIAQSSMDACFVSCSGLLTIGAELFSSQQIDNLGINKVKGTNFSSVFAFCTVLNNLPSHIFHNQIYCLGAPGAFYNCINLTLSPISCFEGCTVATNLGQYQLYTPNGISSAYTYGVFGECRKMTEVQANCFKECIAVTDYSAVFNNCILLNRLPVNLFDDSPNVTTFYYSFYGSKIGY